MTPSVAAPGDTNLSDATAVEASRLLEGTSFFYSFNSELADMTIRKGTTKICFLSNVLSVSDAVGLYCLERD